ncbi:MAG TPA: S-layer homology domain-containing protein, partial [Thermoanaerobaculia bacterium]
GNENDVAASALAHIQVPEGARLGIFRSWAFDSDPDIDLKYRVWETCQPYGYDPPAVTLIAENQTLAAIGYIPGAKSLNNLTVNNGLCAYTVEVQLAPSGEGCRGPALRVYKLQFTWTRQVSPAPAVASFTDVPTTHPFFRFIEALKDSGITGGCSVTPALYCPNSPITRGEMAVFLAAAFGLSWP